MAPVTAHCLTPTRIDRQKDKKIEHVTSLFCNLQYILIFQPITTPIFPQHKNLIAREKSVSVKDVQFYGSNKTRDTFPAHLFVCFASYRTVRIRTCLLSRMLKYICTLYTQIQTEIQRTESRYGKEAGRTHLVYIQTSCITDIVVLARAHTHE